MNVIPKLLYDVFGSDRILVHGFDYELIRADEADRIYIERDGVTLGSVRVIEINNTDCRIAFEFDRDIRIARKEAES